MIAVTPFAPDRWYSAQQVQETLSLSRSLVVRTAGRYQTAPDACGVLFTQSPHRDVPGGGFVIVIL